MKTIYVNKDNKLLLQDFINNIGEAGKTFRYFNSRNINVIDGHLKTLLFVQDEKPVAYGHLEKESEDVWLGICVTPSFKGKGYGKLMMNALIQEAFLMNIDKISLTVDKSNKTAIRLYENIGFMKVNETEFTFKYEFQL